MRRSLILETGTRTVFQTVMLFSIYLLFAGHNAPGGGFIGGLVAGGGLVLRYIAEGAGDVRRMVRVSPEALLGLGVLCAAGTGAAAWLTGDAFLESGELIDVYLPVLGGVHAYSVLVFDIGVYLVVVGLVLAVLRTLGTKMTRGSTAGSRS